MLPEQVAERVIDFCLTEVIPSWVDRVLSFSTPYESVATPLESSETDLFKVIFAFIEKVHFGFGDSQLVKCCPAAKAAVASFAGGIGRTTIVRLGLEARSMRMVVGGREESSSIPVLGAYSVKCFDRRWQSN